MTGLAPNPLATALSAARAARALERRISGLDGCFVDSALEQEFRLASWTEWARRVSVVAIVASLLTLGFGYVDYKALGWTPALALMWSIRLALVALAIAIARTLARPGSVARLDTAALTLMLSIAALVICVVYLQRKGVARETPATLLAVIGFYVFIPTRLSRQVLAAATLSVAFLWAQAVWGPPAPVEWISAATQFLIMNALGAWTALRNHVALRREYLGLQQDLRHRRELQETIDALEQSNAALEQSNTALAHSNSALEKSNAELEQFAYVASHDLQSPLRSVVSFAQLLQRRHGQALDGEGAEYLDTIVGSASHMHRLIHDLLAFSRVGRSQAAFVAVDTAEVVDGLIRELSTRMAETGGIL